MLYQFRCQKHGEFEVSQPMMAEHKAVCPECGEEAQRVYVGLQWIWSGTMFRPDGSRRPDEDFACLKG